MIRVDKVVEQKEDRNETAAQVESDEHGGSKVLEVANKDGLARLGGLNLGMKEAVIRTDDVNLTSNVQLAKLTNNDSSSFYPVKLVNGPKG